MRSPFPWCRHCQHFPNTGREAESLKCPISRTKDQRVKVTSSHWKKSF
jgi:hypothetical protein